ncbi:MAG: hypothetical protein M1546_24820 [Chloroflexi bacterium]|nr:hypothetical protein [Chloroflexota bacterium]
MRNYRQIRVRQGSLGKYPAQAKAMGRLHGKVILVTGADSAVGCDAAIAFARGCSKLRLYAFRRCDMYDWKNAIAGNPANEPARTNTPSRV